MSRFAPLGYYPTNRVSGETYGAINRHLTLDVLDRALELARRRGIQASTCMIRCDLCASPDRAKAWRTQT